MKKINRLYDVQISILIDAENEEDASTKADFILCGADRYNGELLDFNTMIHSTDLVDCGKGIETLKKLRTPKKENKNDI
jgi:hypothetical protein